MPLFRLDGVRAAYNGSEVLKGVSLSIRAGERVALVGKSGAGKSTLLRLLYEHKAKDTALVPQDHGLVRTLSVFHNVHMGRLHRHSTAYNLLNLLKPFNKEVERVRDVLRTLQLEDKLFAAVGELSGGQRQRTAVARALNQQGDVLLGDEPVSAVDNHQSQLVLEAINETYDTVVLAMHDIELALQYTDRIIGLKDGQLAVDCPTAGLTTLDIAPLYSD